MGMPATEIPRYEKLKQADKNLSDKAYHQEWEDEKHMIYYPEHITEGYESKQKMNKLRGNEYKRKYMESLGDAHYKMHETPGYLANKELQSLISAPALKKKYNELLELGYCISPEDVFFEHVRGAQARLSSNVYCKAAREVMNFYCLDVDIPQMQLAFNGTKLQSDHLYKAKDKSSIRGKGMSGWDPSIVPFKHARDEESNRKYVPVSDTPFFNKAKESYQAMSDRYYKAKGKEDNEAMRGYQKLSALEHREISHAAKFKDMISPKKYHEEWDEIRHLVYYPVHITPGYEGQVKAANYASSNQYKKKHLAEAYKNTFKAHETEGYKQQLMLHDKLSRINYTKAWNEALQNSPYITETPERALNRYRGQLASNNLYKASAKKIMEHYNLITDEPRMKLAIHAAKIVSDKLYKEDAKNVKSKFGTLLIQDCYALKRLNDIKKLQ